MTFRTRAAIFAAVTFSAAALVTAAAPGFAGEAGKTDSPILNALAPDSVPTLGDALRDLQASPVQAPPMVQPLPEGYVPAGERADADADPATETATDRATYTSLADAVAAQTVSGELDRETNCLAIGVYYESKGEPLTGQLAVAEVILNRAGSGRFPNTVCGVLTQRGQFSFVRGGRLPQPGDNRAWRTAVAVAKVAKADLWDSAAERAMFFHARYVSPGWRRTRIASIGNHIFYR